MKKKILLFFSAMLCTLGVNAEILENKDVSNLIQVKQSKVKISGLVKDVNGEPIIGATLLEKGTSNVQ